MCESKVSRRVKKEAEVVSEFHRAIPNLSERRNQMKQLLIAGFAILLFPIFLFAWDEPDSFHGIKFWRPLTETVKECKKQKIGGITSYEIYDDSRGICWQSPSSYGDYEIRYVPEFSHVGARLIDGKLAFLNLDFHWELYPRTVAIFKERYGAPTKIITETWTSQLGRSVPNQVILWEGRRLSITLRQRGRSADRGQGSYETDLWKANSGKLVNDAIKKAAKGL
jgi:hypothetical protein